MKKLLLLVSALSVLAVTSLAPITASADQATAATATGTFTGANDHITTGGVSVVRTENGGAVVILDTNFSLDGAPDPSVGFGVDGEYIAATDLGELGENTGLQAFAVPASVDVDAFNEIYIWCDEFNVSLGVAILTLAAQ
jgi:hypothetical protein